MAKMNALQEQLHKAGLAKKSKVAAAAREQGKAPSGPSEAQRDVQRAREEKVEREYRFTAHGAIRSLLVDEDQAKKLASGLLVIAALDDRYELLPRAVGDQSAMGTQRVRIGNRNTL